MAGIYARAPADGQPPGVTTGTAGRPGSLTRSGRLTGSANRATAAATIGFM